MKKSCFIIMPISDNANYPEGHFNRVYEYIIKPACELANFEPIRADEVTSTNYIALDIIKKIIETDLAICDLSSQNANVLYELGIRQAFNKPVVLIKDNSTKRIFDIQGFRDIEYDSNLRIDNVNLTKELLSKVIINTYENKEVEINSLIKLLSISPAEITESTKISVESELILNQLNSINNRLTNIEKTNNDRFDSSFLQVEKQLSFEEALSLVPGDRVRHERFGIGTVKKIESAQRDSKIEINFDTGGNKRLLLRFISLKKIIID